MTILQAGRQLTAVLNTLYDAREAASIAELIMENVTGFANTERLIKKNLLLTAEQQEKLQAFKEKLLQHMPVQYILNETWFAGLKFYVDENVLIPRPETEELVELIVSDIKPDPQNNLSVIDIGTGSGCIAISLKKKLPALFVYALEISDKAMLVAQKNAVDNGTDIRFLSADILHWQEHESFSLFDIIVSNPPYIRRAEAGEMSPNVLQYEPGLALFVPDDNALLFYKAITDFALQNLRYGTGKIFFEINETMGTEVAALLRQKGFSGIDIRKDMQGKDRMVAAVLK